MRKTGKILLLSLLTMLVLIVITACGSNTKQDNNNKDTDKKVFHADNGNIKVPKHPKRIVLLATTYTGNLIKLGITPVGVVDWSTKSKYFQPSLKNTQVVTSDSLEKIVKLNPDLIITYDTDKNIKKLSKIAPTVAFKYDKYSYLDQHVEIGKLVGKEKEAKDWVTQWKQKTEIESKKVKSAIGENATATVVETFGKDLYVYGKNWGRGTEVIYQALGLKAPEMVEKQAMGPGYKAISTEVIPQYAGDYIFLGDGGVDTKPTFINTEMWKNIPAVKKGHVITFDSNSFYFNDPISLEKELTFIVNHLTKK